MPNHVSVTVNDESDTVLSGFQALLDWLVQSNMSVMMDASLELVVQVVHGCWKNGLWFGLSQRLPPVFLYLLRVQFQRTGQLLDPQQHDTVGFKTLSHHARKQNHLFL